jgi:ABC-type antimicrobial peptide transport system permease subunit
MLMVASRTKEFGVRMALGAAPTTIVINVLGAAVRPLLPAGIAGLVIAIVVLRAFRPVFFEVTPTDLVTFSLVCALLFIVAVLAALLPGRRAARIEPIKALRTE